MSDILQEMCDWNSTWKLIAAGVFMCDIEIREDIWGQEVSIGYRRKMMVFECEEEMVP